MRKRAVRLTPDQWAEVRRLRDDLDLSTDKIAAQMGVNPRTIERYAEREGWPPRVVGPKRSARDPAVFEAFTVAARRSLIQRLYKAMDTKLNLMERRMKTQLANLGKEGDLSSADHERDARAFGTIIKNIDQVKEMQADLERVAGGQPNSAADAELFAEADRFRREIAERLARFVPPAG
jgi:hypothetical protein